MIPYPADEELRPLHQLVLVESEPSAVSASHQTFHYQYFQTNRILSPLERHSCPTLSAIPLEYPHS